jgi:hypothetical protein
MPNYLPDEVVIELRQCYDEGLSKHKAMKKTKLAEATVYRYYAKWQAFDDAVNHVPEIIDLRLLHPHIAEELVIQAGMRQMSLANFVLTLLCVIAKDYLFNSILEIEEDNPAKGRLRNAK